ncbi:MAG: phosphoenolpyruvate--protein phosphotransferase [Verrucomicrobia bacterium]|nr:phosphoenolpyruvate--protein phosphotransferase [Verrucomicrobiota bacterium]
MANKSHEGEIFLEGSALSRGIAIGYPLFLDSIEVDIPEISIEPNTIQNEVERYKQALYATKNDLISLKCSLEQEGIKDGVEVLDAHVQLTDDPLLNIQVEEEIAKVRKNAEFVLSRVMKGFSKKFSKMQDPFFQQRFEVVQDIYKRVYDHLSKTKRECLAEIPAGSIVFAQSITPSSAAEANRKQVAAFVTQFGGAMSHMAIVAKAKGIPYVANINFSKFAKLAKSKVVIVDGLLGRIIINPNEQTLNEYKQLQGDIQSHFDKLKSGCVLPSATLDGEKIRLSANVEIADDFSQLQQFGAEGVGLFRSEYLVLRRGCFPTEEEQFEIYRNLIEHMSGFPVVIRAFDLGMDKILTGYPQAKESGQGTRAIRFLLKEKEIFTLQVRAILRASIHGDVRILFPMVSSVSELREAKDVVYRAYDALLKEGYNVPNTIKLGCMVEIPSAAMIADLLARECDFLSIGTNDLIQYALAIDRTQTIGNDLFTSTHPGVVRLIKVIVQAAHHESVPVCVCGEIASDPRFVPLLIGLGITELSVASRFLPLIKHVVRNTTKQEAVLLAQHVLKLKTAVEIQNVLVEHYKKGTPEAAKNHY